MVSVLAWLCLFRCCVGFHPSDLLTTCVLESVTNDQVKKSSSPVCEQLVSNHNPTIKFLATLAAWYPGWQHQSVGWAVG